MKIFVASTGRCGTVFMSEIMRKLTPVPSFHEPVPWCVDDTLEEVNNIQAWKYSTKTTVELEAKLEQVEKDSKDGWYFESNQMFIKSYCHLMSRREIGVIYLWRNPMDVLFSYTKKCRNREDGWFLKSHWNYNLLKTQEPLPFYENILWQSLEIRERYLKYKPVFAKTYELDFRNLNKPQEWKKLFEYFDIPHRKFDELPVVKRNEIPRDDGQTIAKLRDEWTEQGTKRASTLQFEMKEKLIEFAKRHIALNSAEVNQCRS